MALNNRRRLLFNSLICCTPKPKKHGKPRRVKKVNKARKAEHSREAKQGTGSHTRRRQTGQGKRNKAEKPNRAREAKHAREGFLAFCLFGFLLFWLLLVSEGFLRNTMCSFSFHIYWINQTQGWIKWAHWKWALNNRSRLLNNIIKQCVHLMQSNRCLIHIELIH